MAKYKWEKFKKFPNAIFNKENKIWDKQWTIRNLQELRKLFECFGFTVITEEQRLEKYKTQLENIIPKLEKIGLEVDTNGILDFENLAGCDNWPKINGKILILFPSSTFNKENKIGDERWSIYNKKELAKLFAFLGFQVKKEY